MKPDLPPTDATRQTPARRSVPTDLHGLARLLLTLVVATVAALAFSWLGSPLPWMLGPLIFTAVLSMAGAPMASSGRLRNGGQWAIGTALGLYFTPEVAGRLVAIAPWALLGALWALVLGYAQCRWLIASQPPGRVHRATAYFAAVIGGASEMAQFAEREGARVDLVAAAHSLRVLMVVVLIPFGYQFARIHGGEPTPGASIGVHPAGLLVLGLATSTGAWLMTRLHQPNPWVLGPLLVAMALAASGTTLSALPGWLSGAAQLAIGVSLGTRFSPDFLRTAPRWLAAVAVGTLGMIALSAGFAWTVATLAGLDPAAVLLGTSPGGITEMCITAKVLQLGVPLVTAFHVVRYVLVLVLAKPVYRRFVAEPDAASSSRGGSSS